MTNTKKHMYVIHKCKRKSTLIYDLIYSLFLGYSFYICKKENHNKLEKKEKEKMRGKRGKGEKKIYYKYNLHSI